MVFITMFCDLSRSVCLPPRSLAIALAAVAQHDAEHIALALLAVGANEPRTGSKIHLRFFSGEAFHPTEGKRRRGPQPAYEPLDAVVSDGRGVLAGQVLVDALRRQPLV